MNDPLDVPEVISYVQTALSAQANPEKAVGMQAYMKTDMPFYGVQKQGRKTILGHIVQDFAPRSREEYEALTVALWRLPHREEKYLALAVARHFDEYEVPASLSLYHRLIVEGAWWDFVDDVATHMIRTLVLDYPHDTWPTVETWNEDDDMWLRRTSIICQIGAGERIDADRLFRFCRARMHESEFFIRKAIGWALRDHARTDPRAVAAFTRRNRSELSGLSFREATKHIGHLIDS